MTNSQPGLYIQPVTLSTRLVRLEPLSEAHVPDLCAVGLEESIWLYMRYGIVRTEADMRRWVRMILEWQQRGTDLPFAVIWLESGRAVGCTRYLNINPADRNLEIGGTWYGREYQGTLVNPSCKYLLLKHAFETLGCVRVQFKADARNLRSQRALERIGAVREGVLRNHMILEDGHIRDSVFYSILPGEWPQVKARLEGILGNTIV
jgi:RimJ/RimL family protein N-acetyltransferase